MSKTDHDKISAMVRLEQESQGILEGGKFTPLGESETLVEEWGELARNPKSPIGWRDLKRVGLKLQRLRRIGIPVYSLMGLMALKSSDHPQCSQGVKSDVFQELAVLCVEDEGDLNERIGKFIYSRYSSYLCYDPRTGGVSTLPAAKAQNISSGNYEHVLYSAIREEFAEELSPNTASAHYLQSVVQNAIRVHMGAETPVGELERVYRDYRAIVPDHFPELDPEKRPRLISEGTGAWGEFYQRLSPLFEVYGILGCPREEELFTRSLLGIVTRTYQPGEVMQWTLLLSGAAGCGKSVLGTILALDTAPAVVITPSDLGKVRTIEALAGASAVIIDEADVGTSKRDIAENKSFLTQTHFWLRKAFRRDPEPILASWTVISTMNAETLPHDDGAGMRRYGSVKVPGGMAEGDKRAAFLAENRRYLQALLVHLHKAEYPINLGADLVSLNSQSSRDLIEVPDEVHLLGASLDNLAKLMKTADGNLLWLTTKSVWSLISNDKFHPRRVAGVVEAMKEAGWEYRRSQGKGSVNSFYWAPPGTPAKIGVEPIHPDTLPTFRKALAGSSLVPLVQEDPEESEGPPEALKTPSEPVSLAPPIPEPTPETPEIKAHNAQVKLLRDLILKTGNTPPNTDSTQELSAFYRSVF